jgi:hypothetical protein
MGSGRAVIAGMGREEQTFCCKMQHTENVPITIFFPQAQPKSRANTILRVTADLDYDDLEEVMPYARLRKAHHRAKKKTVRSADRPRF